MFAIGVRPASEFGASVARLILDQVPDLYWEYYLALGGR
jgi:hypothetical protein